MPSVRVIAVLAVLLAAPPAAAQTAPAPERVDDPFRRGSWNFQLAGHAAFEIWNYNGNHEEIYGFAPAISYGLSDAVAAVVAFPMSLVDQRGVDAALQGITFALRSRVYRKGRMSLYFDFEVGVSYADTYTPPRGTRFNYLAMGTVGIITPIRRGLDLMAGAKLMHLSNNGLAGRDRNPDIEALGMQLGVLRRF